MAEREMGSVDCNANGGKFSEIPWSFEANWIITHGSLESSIAVESSDDPITETDHENMAADSPLILKPRRSDSGPCEIKICFKQKYEVGQIYVRSTARAYEIYYATSPHSINEYLSTVRCGVAVRDDKVLQTSSVEDVVAEEHGECLSGYITAETASNGGSTATSEDDWVKIRVSGDGSSPASDKTGTNGLNTIQDLYEATAQISDSDPFLSLTIRLLSLEDKGQVCVDEIYVFVDPVESTDSVNGAVLAGTSAQSSLLAMFVPTLLQLSKSGINQAQQKSDEVLKNHKMESESATIDKIGSPQQSAKPEESYKDTTETAEHQQHTSSNKCDEEKNTNGIQPSRLETAMEQLVSRLSRVEDICLRFEEKMLKPIERIEARLQQVENQLEKLAKNSLHFGSPRPRGTRISAPDFSCTESNSSSFYEGDLEKKDIACENMPGLSLEATSNPGLIMSAPEFSYGEGDDDNDALKPLEDSPLLKPKKTLSVDDALAAALNGFMSAAVNSSEPIKIPTRLLGDEDEEIQYQGQFISCEIDPRDFPAAVNDNTESSQYAQGLTVKAPDFMVEDTVREEQSNFVQSSLDVASASENKREVEIIPPGIASADSCVNTESSAHDRILTVKAPDFTVEDSVSEEQLNSVPSSLGVASVTGNERKNKIDPPSIASADSSDNTDSSSAHAQILTVKAPDFTVEDTVSEEQLNPDQSSLDVASVMENERKDKIISPSIASADLCDNTESSAQAQILTVEAPGFTKEKEDTVSEEQLNSQPSLDVVSVTENERKDQILSSSTDSAVSCKFGINEGADVFGSASNGDSPAAKINMIETYFEGSMTGSPAEISKDPVPNSAKDLTVCVHQTSHETNHGKLHEAEIVAEFVKQNVAKESFEDDAGCVFEPSHVAFVDLEFPILEVKFVSDEFMSTKSALEALLDYEGAELTTEVSSIDTNGVNDVNAKEVETVCSNGDEATDHPLPTNGLLLDLGISAADLDDAPKSLEGPPSIEEKMAVSLI